MFVLGTAILLFNVRKARACEPPCTLTCGIDSPNQTICDGGSATFTCTNSDGVPEYTYSWTGPNGFSANTAAITINPAHAVDAGAYSCVVTDVNNCAAQASAILIVGGIKSVTVDSPTICPGATATIIAHPVVENFPSGSPHWDIAYNPDCNGCYLVAADGGKTATFKPSKDFSGVATITASCGGSTKYTTITTAKKLSITPQDHFICTSKTKIFHATGSLPPYTWGYDPSGGILLVKTSDNKGVVTAISISGGTITPAAIWVKGLCPKDTAIHELLIIDTLVLREALIILRQ